MILASRSSVLNALFQANLSESHTNILKIEDIEPEVFTEVLHFIYTGKINNLEELATELLAVAEKYMLEILKAKCEDVLAQRICR